MYVMSLTARDVSCGISSFFYNMAILPFVAITVARKHRR
ncbi:hypothetical protein C7379_10987 [Hallella colorans]|uniref:Uncharacterized protein n=1 Tax=Hallella colorans TaxID=1703337 RepID=A0A2U0U7Z9_9BACT|nr:hypothetical protein C7379_10987 [Hallella colorans]